jgi:hypothetical protein
MTDHSASLQQFVDAYRSHKIPPPHFLLIGADEIRRSGVAETFAYHLGVKLTKVDATKHASSSGSAPVKSAHAYANENHV